MYPGGGGGADFVGGSSDDPSVDLLLVKSRGFAGSSFLSGSCRSQLSSSLSEWNGELGPGLLESVEHFRCSRLFSLLFGSISAGSLLLLLGLLFPGLSLLLQVLVFVVILVAALFALDFSPSFIVFLLICPSSNPLTWIDSQLWAEAKSCHS